jgi:hypothetical protein
LAGSIGEAAALRKPRADPNGRPGIDAGGDGAASAAVWIAMFASRHMHEYGLERDATRGEGGPFVADGTRSLYAAARQCRAPTFRFRPIPPAGTTSPTRAT